MTLPPVVQSPSRAATWTARLLVFLAGASLFSIQPILTKLLVPVSGGTALGWVLMLLVGQLVAALGAILAPVLAAQPRLRLTTLGPAALGLGALLWGLPVTQWLEALGDQPTPLRILGWLIAAMVPGALALAVASPWLQSQLARRGVAYPRQLAGWSTAGAIVGLLLVPLVVEPLVGFQQAAFVWRVAASAVLVGLVGWAVFGAATAPAPVATEAAPRWTTWLTLPRPARHTALWWTFVPVFFLGASSTWVATELPPGPWWWTASLGAYLLSWVLASALGPRRTWVDGTRGRILLLGLLGGVVTFVEKADVLPTLVLLLQLVGGLVAHRRLLRAPIAADRLAAFWAWSSVGSLVGGLMGSVVPMLVFETLAEFPLSLLCWLSIAGPWWQVRRWRAPEWIYLGFVAVFLGMALFDGEPARAEKWHLNSVYLVLLILPALSLITHDGRRRPALMGLALVLMLVGPRLPQGIILHTRSPFGTIQLVESRLTASDSVERRYLGVISGSTLHGLEPREGPMTGQFYYAADGGYVEAMGLIPATPDRRMTLVGMGLGNLICTAKPDDHWTIMELDPVMVRVAQSATARSWRECAQDRTRLHQAPTLWIGDGRLLAKRLTVEGQQVDFIALDAFSSDAIPMHLLTHEAFTRWRAALRPGGLVVAHISNRHLDLVPVLRAEARRWSDARLYRAPGPSKRPANATAVPHLREPEGLRLVVFAHDALGAQRLAALEGRPGWAPLKGTVGPMVHWTDDRTPFWRLWMR